MTTTAAWSSFLDQTTDAAFRVWGSELSVKLAAVGMVQTADTGQINWTTVTRAAGSTAAGYEIWRLSSSNLFFKLEYGSGNANTSPSLWLTAGTGSNGSGTLTGQQSTRKQVGATANPTSTTTNYQSYLCASANYFGLAWKIGASAASQPRAFIGCMQTVDGTGATTSVGYMQFVSTAGGFSAQCVATTAAVTGTATTGNIMFVPNNSSAVPTTFADGAGNTQAMLWWYSILGTTPMVPMLHCATILPVDLTLGNTASMTLVGSTPHTYINVGIGLIGDGANIIGASNLSTIMIYE